MDYTLFTCRNHFSQGQINRMQFILDPTYGARKSLLLGNSSCADCSIMTGYQPVISPNTTTVFQLNELANATFGATFVNDNMAFINSVSYTWTLLSLDSANTSTGFGNTFQLNTPITLGNYSLTLKADVGNGCFKTTTFLFSIVPNTSSSPCISLPDPTSTTGWGMWNRVYYENGWSRSNNSETSPYTYGNSSRTIVTENSSNSIKDGFDIIDISQLQFEQNFSDIATTTLTSNPAPPASLKLMRVGKIITATADLKDGAAYYVDYTFHPTAENCKYRVWYLGISNIGVGAPTIAYQNFNVNQQNTSTSFGFLSRYKFNSTALIDTSISPAVTYLGMNENGYLVGAPTSFSNVKALQFGLNDMVFGRCHSVLTSDPSIGQKNINNTPYRRTEKWQYYDIDFSEFVNTPGYDLATDITLTFFARTNDAIPARSHSYAYFGIECKGGGMPADLTMNFPNVQLPCQQGTNSYVNTINLPRPKYALERKLDNGNSYFSWLNPSASFSTYYPNLATIKVERSTNSSDGFSPLSVGEYLKNVSTDEHYSENYLYLANQNAANTSLYYKVTLKTLHKTLVSVFKVTNGNRINAAPPCIERLGVIAAGNETINYNSNQTITLNYQSLTNCDANPTPPQPNYIWKKYTCANATCTTFTEPTVIAGATGASLTINTSDYPNCRTYIARYTSFEYPYCGNQFYKASVFTLNNTAAFAASSYTALQNNICITDTFSLTFSKFSLTLPNCPIPPPTPGQNSVTLQLAKTNNDSNLLGQSQIINFDSNLFNTSGLPFSLSFNNVNTPPTPVPYVFNNNGNYTIYLRIQYNLFGSAAVVEYKPINLIVSNSPVPGKLGAVTATCSTFSIANSSNSSDITSSYNNQWGWQYSSAPNGVYYDMPIPTASSLSNYQFSQIPLAVPFYIRRFSIGGTGSCANPTYTSAVKVTNKPSFEDLSVCRATTSSLNIAEPNGISGIWTPSLLPYPQTTTVYSSTNFPNLATPITFTVDNGSGVCPTPITQQPTVTINVIPAIANLPALPATTSQTVCQGTSFSQLNPTSSSAAGCVIKWYLYQGGSSDPVDSSQQIPISNPALTYYPANSASSCRGPKSGVIVTVTPNITPTFTQVPAICSGASLTALPTTSTNGITGTWSPTLNNTASTLYTFTPTTGQCATTASMTITVNPNVTPAFTQVSATCSGATLSALPTTSTNGITGTWSPTLNNTASTLYTFTPTTGQCATTASMTITVNPNVTPAFTQVSAICSGASLSALPTTSTNGITGTWSPTLNNTATTLYTFTPTVGQCATTKTMTININTIIAVNDDFSATSINGSLGGATSTSVFANDTINGLPALNTNVTVAISSINPSTSNIIINTGGIITIAAYTQPGTYFVNYIISQNLCTSNIATATVVVSNIPLPLSTSVRADAQVNQVELQQSGKILIKGYFMNYNDVPRLHFARLNTDLTLDTSFAEQNLGNYAITLKVQSDNKIIIGRARTSLSVIPMNQNTGILRLNVDGGIDSSFNVGGIGFRGTAVNDDTAISDIAIQDDGKIIVVGRFNFFNNNPCNNIVRLNADGTIDNLFNTTSWQNCFEPTIFCAISHVFIQLDGKILISGNIIPDCTDVSNDRVKNLVRLEANGTLDTSFTYGKVVANFNNQDCYYCPINYGCITSIKEVTTSNGLRILISGGNFLTYNTSQVENIFRLRTNGFMDDDFTPPHFDKGILDFEIENPLDPSSNIIVGGEFTNITEGTNSSIQASRIVRLKNNGIYDNAFNAGSGATDPNPNTTCSGDYCPVAIFDLKRQPDGKTLLAGNFTKFKTLPATFITRIYGEAGAQARNMFENYVGEPEIDLFNKPKIVVNNEVTIYPNPSEGIYTLDLTFSKEAFTNLTVYNVLGKEVLQMKITPNILNQIDLQGFSAGYYTAKLFSNTVSVPIKLIKK